MLQLIFKEPSCFVHVCVCVSAEGKPQTPPLGADSLSICSIMLDWEQTSIKSIITTLSRSESTDL